MYRYWPVFALRALPDHCLRHCVLQPRPSLHLQQQGGSTPVNSGLQSCRNPGILESGIPASWVICRRFSHICWKLLYIASFIFINVYKHTKEIFLYKLKELCLTLPHHPSPPHHSAGADGSPPNAVLLGSIVNNSVFKVSSTHPS